MSSTNSDSHGFAIEEAPTIQIQYCADPQHPFSDYAPPSPYDISVGGQTDLLFACRSGAASDSGSDASCHSSPSSSPYLRAYSPTSLFTGVNSHFDRLLLDRRGNESGSGIYTSYHPSTHSLNEMSLPNPDVPDAPYYPESTYQSRGFHHSMPDLLSIPSEYPTYFDGMNAPPGSLCRSPSSCSSISSSYIPNLHTPNEMQDINVPSMEFPQGPTTRHGHRRSSTGSSISMNSIRDLIDKDFPDGQSLDARQVHENLIQTLPAHRRLFFKPPKNTVATVAGQLASDKRRKHPGKFLCSIEGCPASFTRKLGLENHIKSHLGIADQECDFCHRLFSNSLGRHMKRCKQNPSREPSSSKKSTT